MLGSEVSLEKKFRCEMHQTQTFVHLITLLLPRAHTNPGLWNQRPSQCSRRFESLSGKLQVRDTVLKTVPKARPDLPEI